MYIYSFYSNTRQNAYVDNKETGSSSNESIRNVYVYGGNQNNLEYVSIQDSVYKIAVSETS